METMRRLRQTATTPTDRALHRAVYVVGIVAAVLVGVLADRAGADIDGTPYDPTTTTQTAVVSSQLVFVVDVPNEPETATRKLSEALRELGATATCPGECLEYVDGRGTIVVFRFNP